MVDTAAPRFPADGSPPVDPLTPAVPPPAPRGGSSTTLAALPVALALLLLLLAIWFQGAFALEDWAPVAVVVLVVAAALSPRARLPRATAVLAGGLWGLAVWTAGSALWSPSPGAALEAAARSAFYAGLVTLALVALPDRAAAIRMARLMAAGLGLLVAGTVAAALIGGPGVYLAGRLDFPLGYRNGTAALLAMAAAWLLCPAAHRRAQPLARATAFAIAVIALGLAFATQSRGVLLGFACALLVMLALGPDRLRRAWLAVLAVCAVAIAADDLLEPYRAFQAGRAATAAEIDHAIGTLMLVAAGAFIVCALGAVLDGGLRISGALERRVRLAAVAVLTVASVSTALVALAAVGDPVALARDKVAEFRQLDAPAPGETRFGSTGGQRYDLWRIAWGQFRRDPVTGAGAGGYPLDYYRQRATDRNLSTPHSLPLLVMAETGAVGVLLLALSLGAAAVAVGRRWRALPADARRWSSGAAAAATVVLAQDVVDWLWLIPGLTGLALLALAVAVRIATAPDPGEAARAPRSRLPGGAFSAAAAAAALLVTCLFISAIHVRAARADDDAAGRLAAARKAERFNPAALAPRYLQAGALERLGQPGQAREVLLEALRVEPDNFVTMALLGDLELRAGRRDAARAWYRRALARNPRDVGLRRLAGE